MIGEAAGAELDRAGRVAVGPDCALPGHPEVFAVGDMVAMDGVPGRPAVADAFGIKVAGRLAMMMWPFVHIAYLVGWGNRFGTTVRWMWTLASRNRRERLIGTPDRGVPPP